MKLPIPSRRITSILISLTLSLLACEAMAQGYQTPIADTWLKEAAPNENHGNDKELSAKNKPSDNFRALYLLSLIHI